MRVPMGNGEALCSPVLEPLKILTQYNSRCPATMACCKVENFDGYKLHATGIIVLLSVSNTHLMTHYKILGHFSCQLAVSLRLAANKFYSVSRRS